MRISTDVNSSLKARLWTASNRVRMRELQELLCLLMAHQPVTPGPLMLQQLQTPTLLLFICLTSSLRASYWDGQCSTAWCCPQPVTGTTGAIPHLVKGTQSRIKVHSHSITHLVCLKVFHQGTPCPVLLQLRDQQSMAQEAAYKNSAGWTGSGSALHVATSRHQAPS